MRPHLRAADHARPKGRRAYAPQEGRALRAECSHARAVAWWAHRAPGKALRLVPVGVFRLAALWPLTSKPRRASLPGANAPAASGDPRHARRRALGRVCGRRRLVAPTASPRPAGRTAPSPRRRRGPEGPRRRLGSRGRRPRASRARRRRRTRRIGAAGPEARVLRAQALELGAHVLALDRPHERVPLGVRSPQPRAVCALDLCDLRVKRRHALVVLDEPAAGVGRGDAGRPCAPVAAAGTRRIRRGRACRAWKSPRAPSSTFSRHASNRRPA